MSTAIQLAPPSRLPHLNRVILHAALSVGAAGLIVKAAATCKEIAVAGVFGRGDAMDAFLAAALIPSLLVNLIAESMNQALVPTLIGVREREGSRAAQQLLSSAMLWLGLLLVAASGAMALAAHAIFPLIASRFPPGKLALSIQLFYALLPIVPLTGIATICTSVLNTLGRFTLPALAPILILVSIVAAALTFGARFGIWAMVIGTVAGTLIHVCVVATMMHRSGYRFSLRWHGMSPAVAQVGRQYGPVLLSGVVASGGLLVDQSMAAMLVAGSVSALVYANRFVSVVLALLAGAISTAIVPPVSRLIAHREWQACRAMLRTWVWYTAALAVPLTILLIAGARPLVRIALQHGAFGPRDTAVVARVLVMFAIQIPFFAVSRVFYRFLIAMLRTDLVLYCGIINLTLDVVLNLVLMRWYGVAGIALATSLWTVSTFLFLWYWANRVLARAEAEVQIATSRVAI
ncbi:MAG: lipid II flippase MurJ [Terracidiphilus sp.]